MLKSGQVSMAFETAHFRDAGHLCNEMAAEVVSYLAKRGTKVPT